MFTNFWKILNKICQALNHNSVIIQLTIYSDGAINSMVEDLISGLLVGSPYVLLTGSYWNSSGTTNIKKIWITVLQVFSTLFRNDCEISHTTDTLPIQQTFPLLSILNFITSALTSFILVLDPVNCRDYLQSNEMRIS